MDNVNLDLIELKHFRLIHAITNTGTISGAARKLMISQSVASRQLSYIEHIMGTPVFSRNNRQMIPTMSGQLLLDLSNNIKSQMALAEQELTLMQRGLGGRVRLASNCPHSYRWIAECIATIKKKYPGFSFDLSYDDNLSFDLSEGQFDILITALPIVDNRYTITHLFVDELVIALPPGHRFAHRKYLTQSDLPAPGEKFFYYFDESSQHYNYHIAPLKVRLKRLFTRVPHLDAALSMVRYGHGFTVLPRWLLETMAPDLAGVSFTRKKTLVSRDAMSLNSGLASHQFVLDELVAFAQEFSKDF